MSSERTINSSRWLLALLGTRTFIYHENRIPREGAVVVVSNHRSALDPVVLTAALGRSIRFACHHYMGQVPLMREIVTTFGAFPLDNPTHRPKQFFKQATQLLQHQEMVGVFPEGAEPMVKITPPDALGTFQRGFAHLALRAPVRNLIVLPVAIASFQEQSILSGIPLKLLSLFDPSEPLFDQPGWHPLVVYQRTNVLIGRPYWITPKLQQQYQGKLARKVVEDLTTYCKSEIADLLRQGCV